jgi:HEAT repeat protein
MAVLDARGLAAAMPQLPADRQVQALAALVHHDRAIARPLLLSASGSDVEAVRVSAIEGLAATGTAADVALLATRAATATGTEQAAARQALARLPGEEVDSAIVSSLAGASGKQLIELIRAAGERGIGAAAPALIRAGESNDAAVRKAALKALKDVAPASDIPALLSMLPRCQEDDRSDCERALAHSLRRGAKPDVQAVAAAFAAQSSAEVRASLVNVLGTVALSDGLPTLRKALSAPEPEVRRAAVTALGEWPSADPVNDLIEAARSHSDAAIRVLALRGYVKLVRLPSERSAPETARLLAAAMQAARRPDEKKLVLAAAQRVPCPESLELAKAAAADPALAAEAKAARAAIETALKGRGN